MRLSEIEYPLRICVDLMHYAGISCKKTEDLKQSEIIKGLKVFFTDEEINKAINILLGNNPAL